MLRILRTMPKQSRISPSANAEVQAAFKTYADEVGASELSPSTQGMCVDIASNFLQGLEHEYDPRTWIARYPSRKPSLRSKQIHRDVAYELQTVTLVTLLVYFQRASLSGDEDTLIRRCKVEKLTTYLAIVSRASSCR